MPDVLILVSWVTEKGIKGKNPRNHIFLEIIQKKSFQPSGICRKYVKGYHWSNECRSTRHRQAHPLPWGNDLGDITKVPVSNLIQLFHVSI